MLLLGRDAQRALCKAMDQEEQGNDHHHDVVLCGMLVYEINQ